MSKQQVSLERLSYLRNLFPKEDEYQRVYNMVTSAQPTSQRNVLTRLSEISNIQDVKSRRVQLCQLETEILHCVSQAIPLYA